MKIGVVGTGAKNEDLCHRLGYIGLPTALLFSSNHEVVNIDIDPLSSLFNEKNAPFQEVRLEHLLNTSDIMVSRSPRAADAFGICVPTPFDKKTKIADLTFVKQASISVVPYVKKGNYNH
jgi:UDP-N-acetyl-D-mannosaminuronate dehydrogenase